jgi:adenine phosphoribosyltransferase
VDVHGDSGDAVARTIADRVIDVPDFPQAGIVFKDLSPLFSDGSAFRTVVDAIVDHYGADSFDLVAGIEARGFLLAGAVAYATSTGVVPIRKAGKLPRATHTATFDLEYGTATIEVHTDAFGAGARVLVLDDVLATGGTAEATLDLIERAGGAVAGFTILLELEFLSGRERLAPQEVHALLRV